MRSHAITRFVTDLLEGTPNLYLFILHLFKLSFKLTPARDNGVTPPDVPVGQSLERTLLKHPWLLVRLPYIEHQKYSLGYFFVQLLHAITEYNYFQPAAGVPAERSECKPRIKLWAKQKNPRYMVIVPWAESRGAILQVDKVHL